jgi:hypothetical protein
MNVVTMDPKAKQREQRKEELLAVLEEIRRQIESGEIAEYIACSHGDNGVQIHASLEDGLGGVGLLEVGKQLLIDLQFKDE